MRRLPPHPRLPNRARNRNRNRGRGRCRPKRLNGWMPHKISAPYLFFSIDDVLILPAKEIARALTLSVMYINSADIKGDIVEFGTMGGFTARTLAAAMVFDPRYQPNRPLRKLRLFDSFEGLPEITSKIDLELPHVKSGTWSKGGCKILSAGELRTMVEAIIPPSRVEITEGWFADTVKRLPDDTRLALIHFDGDLYQSTMDALVPCFERGFISKGAVFCFDDWEWQSGRSGMRRTAGLARAGASLQHRCQPLRRLRDPKHEIHCPFLSWHENHVALDRSPQGCDVSYKPRRRSLNAFTVERGSRRPGSACGLVLGALGQARHHVRAAASMALWRDRSTRDGAGKPPVDGRPIQDIALKRYRRRELPSPDLYYTYEDVLIVAAQEIAKTLTLCIQYINGSHVYGDIAEFGTMGGFTAKALATSMVFDLQRQPLSKNASGENPFKVLRLFDSFQGCRKPRLPGGSSITPCRIRVGLRVDVKR